MKVNSRGSALLIAIIAVLIVSVIGIGILRFTYRNVAGATASAREQGLVACTQAAQNLMSSRFHALGTDPTLLPMFDVSLSANARLLGGHYGQAAPATIQSVQVKPLPSNAFGPSAKPRDLTNAIVKDAASKAPFKVVVRCRTAAGTELELEYGIKFGL